MASLCTVLLVLSMFWSQTCAQSLVAVVNMGGVKGNITFEKQSSSTKISGLVTTDETELDWSILTLPMLYQGKPASSCASLGNVVHDLTAAHGTIKADTGIDVTSNTVKVSGTNSIFGKSLVLYKKSVSTPLACAIISAPLPTAAQIFSKEDYSADYPVRTSVATFRGLPIAGRVTFRQGTGQSDMMVLADLFYTDSEGDEISCKWKIVPDCTGTGTAVYTSTGKVFAGPAIAGPSTKRSVVVIDPGVTLAGIAGKKVVLVNDTDQVLACASIESLSGLSGYSYMNGLGIVANFKFFQMSLWDPTYVKIDITGLDSRAKNYHVHDYPVIPSSNYGGAVAQCSGTVVSGHWNPYGIDTSTSPPSGNGTYDEYELGDLSGKHGTFAGMSSVSELYEDYNLPLYGKNSILHRSIVIHRDDSTGSRFICNTIHQSTGGVSGEVYNLVASAVFDGSVLEGIITFTSVGPYNSPEGSTTAVHLKLRYKDDETKITNNHKWHVHKYAVGNDCTNSVQGHYNPYDVSVKGTYSTACSKANMLRCEVGDNSQKSKKCSVGPDLQQMYTDIDLPLMGPKTILGRSIVIHEAQSGGGRIDCATIEYPWRYKRSIGVEKTGGTFDINSFASELAKKLKVEPWRIVPISSEEHEYCYNVAFYAIDSTTSNLYSDIRKLGMEEPRVVGDYKIRATCAGCVTLPTVLVLVLAALVSLLSRE